MPKIIENVRDQLLREAKKQIAERGYASTTIRSVAGECNLAVGTVYNYFKSKEMLIATFVAEDWRKYLDVIAACPTDDAKKLLHCIYNSLSEFSEGNKKLFSDADAAKVISIGFATRHKKLRDQLAAYILPICSQAEKNDFTAEFIAEALIGWTVEGREFDDIYAIIHKILNN